MVLLACIIVVTLILLITQLVRIEIVALGVITTLGLSGVLTPEEALAGFSNSATLTVAAMLVLSAGLQRAGVVDYLSNLLVRRVRGSVNKILAVLAAPTALFSAFVNNTAIVALMVPVALTLARRTGLSASKMLIPISYLSILAGSCTLIGTSTNILVDSLYREAGGAGFGMFEFSGLGLLFLLFGGIYVVLVAPRLLPARAALVELMDSPEAGQFVTEVAIPEKSRLVGKSFKEAFGEAPEIRVLELIRHEQVKLGPSCETRIKADDVLLIEGTARTIHELIDQRKVEQATAVSDKERVKISRIDLRMVEAVVAPNSRFRYRRVQDLGLSRRNGIHVLAVRRLGKHHQYNLREFRLQPGDVLLLQGQRDGLRSLQDDGEVQLVEGIESTLTFTRKAPWAIGILLAVILLAAFNVAPIVILAVAGVAAMLVTGCLTLPRATRALDTSVLLLLAGMIPLGLAMERTGLSQQLADWALGVAGPWGPIGFVAAFYLLTSVLTAVLSNNASAVLLTPICLNVAAASDIDPKPLLIAVAFGASASFATPIGYQTNTMVMGPGGYLVRDYLKVGLPLNLLTCLLATIFIPIFWPP